MTNYSVETLRQYPASKDVLLVSMPFGPLWGPSIALGLLKAELKAAGIAASVQYFTIPFAEIVGADIYQKIATGYPATFDLTGEWVFARGLNSSVSESAEGYVNDVLRGQVKAHRYAKPASDSFIARVVEVREHVEGFLDRCCQKILLAAPKIVGFTSVFQQHTASLGLARRLKAARPEIFIVFGGSNCEGAMGAETLQQFPSLDAVVSGEGDMVFPKLVRHVLAGEPIPEIAGVLCQRGAERSTAMATTSIMDKAHPSFIHHLDDLPIPDYLDFFEQFAASRLHHEADIQLRIPFESSRGCWWGQKQHCTFCGLNGASMAFRSKSAARVLDEMLHLSGSYPGTSFIAVDNILDMKFFKDLIPALGRQDIRLDLFYEVKANLTKQQLRLLLAGGIKTIQPGIESLSSIILKLMRKGTNSLTNIQLLKWCMEVGIAAKWNIIFGFPGEPAAEYLSMAKLVPLITHLTPPEGVSPVRIDRFSPYHTMPESFGLTDLKPYPAYQHIYALPDESLDNLAYYFDARCDSLTDAESYAEPLLQEIRRWRQGHPSSSFFYEDQGDEMRVWDFRPTAKRTLTYLTGIHKQLYLACDAVASVSRLQRICDETNVGCVVEHVLQPLVESGMMLEEDDTYLALAIPLGEYSPDPIILEEFLQMCKSSGQRPSEKFETARD